MEVSNKPEENESPVHENETEQEQLERVLLNQPLARLLSLAAWIEQNSGIAHDSNLSISDVDSFIGKYKQGLAGEDREDNLRVMLTDIDDLRTKLVKRRRILQGRLPVAQAAQKALEAAVKRSEETLQSTTENALQAETLEKTVETLLSNNIPAQTDFNTSILRLLPKREKVVKEVMKGPDLFNVNERIMREGVTAEAAAKADRPMIFHKGLQKWVPLQTGDDTDLWRD